jgi:SAM-dependent methyltransferase
MYLGYRRRRFSSRGRPALSGETSKARPRRQREKFFELYCQGRGLDVGHGGDLLVAGCIGFDIEDGEAARLENVADASFDFVYSSHTLEHMDDVAVSLTNWWRVVKPGGHLILYVPERDLYEKRTRLPSRFNPDHKHFFLLDRDEPPDTFGVLPLVARTLDRPEIVYARVCSDGHTITDPKKHSDGEYSIELVLRKAVV